MASGQQPLLLACLWILLSLSTSSCTDPAAANGPESGPSAEDVFCTIPESLIFQGVSGKDVIPALNDPVLVGPGDLGTEYLADGDRVIGLLRGNQGVAVPLNIMWWHELVNLTVDGLPIAITHCPLTGSSLAFDRGAVAGAEFGVSGLLYQNNLMMYDRTASESLWPQMLRGARCGNRTGTNLQMVPVVEMTWGAWKALYPDTRVVSSFTGLAVDYQKNPYGGYSHPDNPTVLFPISVELDQRFPPKERALGIPDGSGGLVFPFSRLAEEGVVAAVELFIAGNPYVIFWNQASGGAMAFKPLAGGYTLTFQVADQTIIDEQTGSRWVLDGRAVSGPLQGERLDPIAEAFVAFWFAWPAFYPDLRVWEGS